MNAETTLSDKVDPKINCYDLWLCLIQNDQRPLSVVRIWHGTEMIGRIE